ncbi:MAG: MmgE/PrpD family protein [Streptosporangiales bacterium]
MPTATAATELIRDLTWDALPEPIREQVLRSVLDLLGCAVAGTRTPAFLVAHAFSEVTFGTGTATVIDSTARGAPAAAVLCNAFAANALDLDDGYRPLKGHPGSVVIPPALTAAERTGASGARFLAAVVAGYEIGLRTGLLVHQEYAYYHGTGSWGAAGAAAAVAALRELNAETCSVALGIAEFHAPMTPEMHSVDHPSMLKDGIGWGAFNGYTAVDLAVAGVTAPPCLLAGNVDASADLGSRFLVGETYLKRYATCRWAQPAIAAVGRCVRVLGCSADVVDQVVVGTFKEASHLMVRRPRTSEEAQFSLPWAVACGIVRGSMGPDEVAAADLDDPALLDHAARVEVVVDPTLDAAFPDRALAWAEVRTFDGRTARSPTVPAPGDADDPLPDDAVRAKFHQLVDPVMGADHTALLERRVSELPYAANLDGLLAALRGPATR